MTVLIILPFLGTKLARHQEQGPYGVALVGLCIRFWLAEGRSRGRRPGTENVSGICGLQLQRRPHNHLKLDNMQLWRDEAEQMITQQCPQIEIIGANAPRLVNTSCLFLPGLAAQTAIMALDLAGFAVSSGSACSSGKVTSSHVLTAMGRDDAGSGDPCFWRLANHQAGFSKACTGFN